MPAKRSKPSEFDAFTSVVDKVLSVPKEELNRREQEYRERAARNPKKRGPKPKISASVSRDPADDK